MHNRRLTLFTALLLVFVFALVGCGPRATGGSAAAIAGGDNAVVDLPAIVIDIDAEGNPSIGGLPISALASMANIDAAELEQLTIPADIVSQLIEGNIQHIQIDNSIDGIIVLVNGEPIPFFVWDEDSLVTTAEMLETFGVSVALLDRVLPLIRTIGLGAIIRFPVAEGNELIPTVVAGDSSAAAAARAAQEEFLAAAGQAPKIQVVIDYADDGTWQVAGLSEEEWSQIAPLPWGTLTRDPGQIARIKEAGINTISLATNPDGIFISINDKTLPYISWNNGEIVHTLKLAAQLGLLDSVMGGDPDTAQLLETIESLLPMVQAADVNIVVNFK